jgi:CRISPR-associated endonuclease/helicase Cas3
MEFYAHTKKDMPESGWQSLYDHLNNVANLSKDFASPYGLGEEAYFAGLFHDFGKYHKLFQDKLYSNNNFKDHSSQGANYLIERGYYATPVIFAISAHHIGFSGINKITRENFKRKEDLSQLIKDCNNKIKDIKIPENNKAYSHYDDKFIASCIIDSDWTDTANFYDNLPYIKNNFKEYVEKWISIIDNKINSYKINSDLNKKRHDFYVECSKMGDASNETMFNLCGDTGIGKTNSSISFALRNAKRQCKDGIIFVLPYMTITEQTAEELRMLFAYNNILEHHTNSDISDSNWKEYRHFSSNWDFPIIVTTSAQFFNSLFSNKPSSIRKIHNIANKVVILDEVQTIPSNLILPTIDIIKYYNKKFKTNFVFCSATQPDFGISSIDIIKNPENYFIKKSNIILNKDSMTIDEITEKLTSNESAFCIVNTKKIAYKIFENLKHKNHNHNIYYMTTGLCPYHRSEMIKEIKRKISNNENVILVCTQLIEAGVDLSFKFGMRMLAPLDSIIQAQGRVNREAKFNYENCDLLVFKLKDKFDNYYPTPLYGALANISEKYLDNINAKTLQEYYQEASNISDKGKKIIESLEKKEFENLDRKGITPYQFIDSETLSVVVPYNDEAKELIKKIKNNEKLSMKEGRKCNKYSVNIYENSSNNKIKISNNIDNILYWNSSYDLIFGTD